MRDLTKSKCVLLPLFFGTLFAIFCGAGCATFSLTQEERNNQNESEGSHLQSLPEDDNKKPTLKKELHKGHQLPNLKEKQTLIDLQFLAVDRHPLIAASTSRVEAANYRRKASLGDFYPQLRTDARYLRLEDAIESEIPPFGTVVFQDDESFSLQTQLTYALHDWGRRKDTHRARNHELNSEKAQRIRRIQTVALAVAQAYYSILETEKEVLVLTDSLEAVDKALKIARDNFLVKRVTKADVLVVEARRERLGFQLKVVENQLKDRREHLNYWLSLPPQHEVTLAEPFAAPKVDKSIFELIKIGLSHRGELRALKESEESLRRQGGALLSTYLPEFYFFLQHDYTDPVTALSEESLLSGGFGASWSLFDGGSRYNQRNALLEKSKELRALRIDQSAKIVEEIRKAKRNFDLSLEALKVADVVVQQAEENLKRIQNLFSQGKVTGQEVLEAEALLTTEKAEQARAIYRQHLSYQLLIFALGLDINQSIDY